MREQELPVPASPTDQPRDAGSRPDVDPLLGSDEAALAAVAAWQRQNDPLRLLERGAVDEPVPIAVPPVASASTTQAAGGHSRLPAPVQSAFTHIDLALGSVARAVERTLERLFGTPVEHSLLPQALAIALVLTLGVGTGWFGHRAWAGRADVARSSGEGSDTPGAANAGLSSTTSSSSTSNSSASGATSSAAGSRAAQADAPSPASVARGLLREAMTAHAIYGGDPRHVVEIPVTEQDQLLGWLGRRLARPVQPPAIGDLGWKLVGGRLLPGDTGGAGEARAQFTYQNKKGQRLTLYLGVLDAAVVSKVRQRNAAAAQAASVVPAKAVAGAGGGGGTAAGGRDNADTTFTYTSRAQMHASYWTEGQFGYALVGELPRATLEKISVEVYLQTLGLGGQGDDPATARAGKR
jgi:anti-sigma factor RsiW